MLAFLAQGGQGLLPLCRHDAGRFPESKRLPGIGHGHARQKASIFANGRAFRKRMACSADSNKPSICSSPSRSPSDLLIASMMTEPDMPTNSVRKRSLSSTSAIQPLAWSSSKPLKAFRSDLLRREKERVGTMLAFLAQVVSGGALLVCWYDAGRFRERKDFLYSDASPCIYRGCR
ncbi:hypothetical protein [Caudoviricetes sp.]|nr:hypothetical protein [Caudoviricetes sp.]